MTCAEAADRIGAALDRELDADERARFEAHLVGCASCRADAARQQRLGEAIRHEARRYAAPASLRAALARDLQRGAELAGAARPPARSPLWRIAIAASVLVATIGITAETTLRLAVPGDRDLLGQEVVAAHVRSLIGNHVIDVASSDQHTVKPWFNGRVDIAPPVTDLTEKGFALVGGRVDYVGRRTVPALVYRHRQHLINLFVLSADGTGDAAMTQALAVQGYNIRQWSAGGLGFWAISDLNAADLTTFERLVRGAGS